MAGGDADDVRQGVAIVARSWPSWWRRFRTRARFSSATTATTPTARGASVGRRRRCEAGGGVGMGMGVAMDEIPTEGASERDTVCLDRRELQDLLRRVRGLERLIGRVLGGVADGRHALG